MLPSGGLSFLASAGFRNVVAVPFGFAGMFSFCHLQRRIGEAWAVQFGTARLTYTTLRETRFLQRRPLRGKEHPNLLLLFTGFEFACVALSASR